MVVVVLRELGFGGELSFLMELQAHSSMRVVWRMDLD